MIVIQIIYDAGSLLSACINGTCLALLNAGIVMNSLIASSSCAILESDESAEMNVDENQPTTGGNAILTDCTTAQEQKARCVLTFAFDRTLKGVVTSVTRGKFTPKEYFDCLDVAKEECNHTVLGYFRTAMTEQYETQLTPEDSSSSSSQPLQHIVSAR